MKKRIGFLSAVVGLIASLIFLAGDPQRPAVAHEDAVQKWDKSDFVQAKSFICAWQKGKGNEAVKVIKDQGFKIVDVQAGEWRCGVARAKRCRDRRRMMNEPTIREPEDIRRDCTRKLRAVQVSEHFQAILGCLLGEDSTTPRPVEMVITPDGHLLGRCEGEASFKAFLGAADDLLRNIHGVARSPNSTVTRSASSWRKWPRSKDSGSSRVTMMYDLLNTN